MATAPNAYPLQQERFPRSLWGRPTRNGYRAAIKQIILELKARKNLSDQELADLLGCHKETIENAQDEANSLDVVTLLNIAYAFGEEAIQPVRDIYLCAPTEQPTIEDRLARIEGEAAAIRREMAQ